MTSISFPEFFFFFWDLWNPYFCTNFICIQFLGKKLSSYSTHQVAGETLWWGHGSVRTGDCTALRGCLGPCHQHCQGLSRSVWGPGPGSWGPSHSPHQDYVRQFSVLTKGKSECWEREGFRESFREHCYPRWYALDLSSGFLSWLYNPQFLWIQQNFGSYTYWRNSLAFSMQCVTLLKNFTAVSPQ